MSELSTMNNTSVTPYGADPYSAYGAKVGQQGLFLTFKGGEFYVGQDGAALKIGTRLAANVAGLRIGWKRWFAAQVTDDRLVPLAELQPMEPRNMLGDLDSALWEKDDRGVARDPWQLTNELILVDSEGQEYIYATSSKGGIGAIGRLCKDFGKIYRQKPGMVPIIELGNDYYMHKEYGKTYFPVFNLVDWAPEGVLEAIEGNASEGAEERGAPPTQAANAPSPAPAGAPPTAAKQGASTTRSPSSRARF